MPFVVFIDLGITKRDSFSSALKKASNQNFGGTDASVAYDWAIKNKFKADIICFWTDNESWAGRKHPAQALKEYRQKVNPNAKAVYITLAPYNITLVDPQDKNGSTRIPVVATRCGGGIKKRNSLR